MADENEVKKAYRKFVKKYHPDRNKSPGAVEKFREIQNAYDEIMCVMKVLHNTEIPQCSQHNKDDFLIKTKKRAEDGVDIIMTELLNELKCKEELWREQEEKDIKKNKRLEDESMRIMYG